MNLLNVYVNEKCIHGFFSVRGPIMLRYSVSKIGYDYLLSLDTIFAYSSIPFSPSISSLSSRKIVTVVGLILGEPTETPD